VQERSERHLAHYDVLRPRLPARGTRARDTPLRAMAPVTDLALIDPWLAALLRAASPPVPLPEAGVMITLDTLL
jgi:hypothetical protein